MIILELIVSMAHYSIIQRVNHFVFVSKVGAVKIVPNKMLATIMVHGTMVIPMPLAVTANAVGTVRDVTSAADMEPILTNLGFPIQDVHSASSVGAVQIVPKKVLAASMVPGTIKLTEVTVTAIPVGVVKIVPKKVLAAIMVIGTILLTEEVTVPAATVGAVLIVPKKLIADMVPGTIKLTEEVTVPAATVGTARSVTSAADMEAVIIPVREYAQNAIPVGAVQIVPKKVIIAAIMVTGAILLLEVTVPAITVGAARSVISVTDMDPVIIPVRENAEDAIPGGAVMIVPKKVIATRMDTGTILLVAVTAIPVGTARSVTSAADMEAVMMPIRENAQNAIPVGAVMIVINAADMEAVMMPIWEYAHGAIPGGAVQIVPKKVIAAIMVRGTTLLMAGDIVNVIAVSPAIIAIKKKRLRVFNMIAIS